MNRKLWSNEEKVAILLEILRGDEPAAVICTRYGVSATQADLPLKISQFTLSD